MLYQNIQALCKQNDMTIRDLERKCGFANGTVRRWGVVNQPSIDRVAKVADVFHVSIDYLTGRKKK